MTRYFIMLARALSALQGKIDGEFLDHCFEMFDRRWNEFTAECPFVRLAFFLHPLYREAAVSVHGGPGGSREAFYDLYVEPVRLSCSALACPLPMLHHNFPAAGCRVPH